MINRFLNQTKHVKLLGGGNWEYVFFMRYIYITTNLLNGKCYLGQRKVPQGKTIENDAYLGSGTLLLKAIKKYGKENFAKEIIHVCKTQKEADFLEIKEIKQRCVIENPDKWYNRDAGGQYNRSENHSVVVSQTMKDYYSNDLAYTNYVLKTNRAKYLKGKNPNITTIAFMDIERLKRKLIIENRKRSKIEQIEINKLIKIHTQKEVKIIDTDKRKANSKKAYRIMISKHPNIKEKQATGRRKAHELAKDKGLCLFTDDAKRSFGIAKMLQYNNYLGLHIINVLRLDYKPFDIKIRRIQSRAYKHKQAYQKQINELYAMINKSTNEVITRREIIDLIAKCRLKKGLHTYIID